MAFRISGIKGLEALRYRKITKNPMSAFAENKKMNYANPWRLALNISAIQGAIIWTLSRVRDHNFYENSGYRIAYPITLLSS